jgi:hypothetical protein
MDTTDSELNRVLGRYCSRSLILLGGERNRRLLLLSLNTYKTMLSVWKPKQIKWGQKESPLPVTTATSLNQNPKHLQTNWSDRARNCNHWFDSNPSYRLCNIPGNHVNWTDNIPVILIGQLQRPGPKYWNIWLIFTVWRRQKSRVPHVPLKSIWFHSRNWHLRNVRKRFTWSFQSEIFRINEEELSGTSPLPRRDETTHDWDPVIGQYSCLRNASTHDDYNAKRLNDAVLEKGPVSGLAKTFSST